MPQWKAGGSSMADTLLCLDAVQTLPVAYTQLTCDIFYAASNAIFFNVVFSRLQCNNRATGLGRARARCAALGARPHSHRGRGRRDGPPDPATFFVNCGDGFFSTIDTKYCSFLWLHATATSSVFPSGHSPPKSGRPAPTSRVSFVSAFGFLPERT